MALGQPPKMTRVYVKMTGRARCDLDDIESSKQKARIEVAKFLRKISKKIHKGKTYNSKQPIKGECLR